jgi:hypothetical protein
MARGRTGAKEKIAVRRQAVIGYRAAGLTFRNIAERLEISVGLCHSDYAAVMEEIKSETETTVREMRTLEYERLELSITALYPRVVKGDLEAISSWIKTIESECRLLKLYDLPRPEESTPEPPLGIDPDLCSPDELRLLLDIMQRQKEARADETPAASTRNSGKSRESQRPGES